MNAVTNFAFEEQLVRVVSIDGEPWFFANDVCRCLDLSNPRKAVGDLDDDEKGVTTSDTLGGPQEVNIISEPGLYRLVFRSRKPEAERFKRWIAHDVLPSIRKTGSYSVDQDERQPDATAESLQEMRLKFDMQKEARILFGPAVARQMWAQMGFPDPLGSAGVRPPGEGSACLQRIMAYRLEDGATIREHVDRAFAANDMLYAPLLAFGVRIAIQPEPGIHIATAATYLRPILQGTQWANGLHCAALRAMPGAAQGKTMKFGKHASHTTFLPLWLAKGE